MSFVRVSREGRWDWRAYCYHCKLAQWSEDWGMAMEFALGHVAFAHQGQGVRDG